MGGDYTQPSGGSYQYNGDSGIWVPDAPAPAAPVDAVAVVEQMYQDVLGRAPDAGGQQAFVDAINSGADIGALAASMAASQEAQNRGITQQAQQAANNIAADTGAYVQQVVAQTYNADFVNNLYYGVLGRAPDAAGLQNNLNLLNSGAISPDQLAASFAASKEAQTNNISNAQEQQAAQQVVATYGQTGQNKVDTASGNWSGVSASDLVKAGITNQAILSAAATGTLNDNIFGAYKTDANVIANALNTGAKVPTATAQTLNTATTVTGSPSGKIVNAVNAGNGQTVYYYTNGGSVTVDSQGKPVSISLGKEAYRQASTSGDSASLAVADNPGTAIFNGQVVSVSTPHLQWNPSTNSIQNTSSGTPMAYREPTSGGIGADLANFDSSVRNTIPGGWTTIGAIALSIVTANPELIGLSSSGEAAFMAADAANLAANGADAATIAQNLAAGYGISAETAATAAAAATAQVATAPLAGTIESITAAPASTAGFGSDVMNALTAGQADAAAAVGTGGQVAGTGTGIVAGGGSGAAGAGYTGVMGPGVAQTFWPAVQYGAASGAGVSTLTQLASGQPIDLSKVIQGALVGGITGGLANQVLDPALTLTAALKNGALTGVGSGVINSLVTGQPLTINSLAMGAVIGAAINGIANQYTLSNGNIRQMFADGSTAEFNPQTGRVTLTDATLPPGQGEPVIDSAGNTYYYTRGADGRAMIYNGDGTLNAQQTASFNPQPTESPYSPVAGEGTGVQTGIIPKTTNGWNPITQQFDIPLPDPNITGEGVVGEGKIVNGNAADALPTPEQLQLRLNAGEISQETFDQEMADITAVKNATPGVGTGGAGVTSTMVPVVPTTFTNSNSTIPGTTIPVVNPQYGTPATGPVVPGSGGTGTTGTGSGSGTTGTGAGAATGPVAPGTGTGNQVGSGTGNGGIGSGTGTGGIGSGGGGGGIGSGGGGGMGSGGGGGMGSGGGGGAGGSGPGVVIPPKPATTTTQTTIIPKSTLPNLSGGLANPGLNPGWMNQGVQPMYATNSPVQSEYYWGGHPYMPDYASLQNYNKVPAAPATPWGLQQPSAPLTSYLPAGYTASGPVAPVTWTGLNPNSIQSLDATFAAQSPIMPQPLYGIPKI